MTSEPSAKTTPTVEPITFAGVSPEFVLRVCERLLAHIDPSDRSEIEFGGIKLRLYVNSHWSGFERYMLLGRDWTIGFNLKPADETPQPCENVFKAFAAEHEVFTPHITGERYFLRDATVLKMTESDWLDDGTPVVW